MNQSLVIGATGFIGLNVVDSLLEAGTCVRATRRVKSITMHLRRRNVALVHAELEDVESLARAMDGCDVVYHTAGHYPRYSLDLEGSVTQGRTEAENVVDACVRAGVRRLVYTSTMGVLDPAPPGRLADERDIGEERPTDSVYRAVKWEMQQAIEAGVARGLEVTSLLPGACVGPGDLRLGTGGLLVAAVTGRLPWYIDGYVCAVDVRDVANAHVHAGTVGVDTGRYCLGGHGIALSALLEQLVARYGGTVPDRRLDAATARRTADEDERRAAPKRERVPFPRELVDMMIAGQPVCSDRARAALGFVETPLEETLDAAYGWFARHGYLTAKPADDLRRTDVG